MTRDEFIQKIVIHAASYRDYLCSDKPMEEYANDIVRFADKLYDATNDYTTFD